MASPVVQEAAKEGATPNECRLGKSSTPLKPWQEIWLGDRQKFEAKYPDWVLDAAAELFAHDICDRWAWDEYAKAAAVIIKRHWLAAQAPLPQVQANFVSDSSVLLEAATPQLKYFYPPFKLVEPETETAANIVDSKGNLVAMMYWPTHPVEETLAAEQETYAIGRIFAATLPKDK